MSKKYVVTLKDEEREQLLVLIGSGNVKVMERRTKVDWAYCMRDLMDIHFPQAEKIVIVQDQLNTHSPACLYEVFSPAEAKRILDRLEFHSTPKHGSWLNMAEIELSVLGRQCLNRYIPSQAILTRETEAWMVERNNKEATVNWQFATTDARIKLKRLYPSNFMLDILLLIQEGVLGHTDAYKPPAYPPSSAQTARKASQSPKTLQAKA